MLLYVFDIRYPQPLNIPLTFIQHFVYSIKEDVIPQALVRFISYLDKLNTFQSISHCKTLHISFFRFLVFFFS